MKAPETVVMAAVGPRPFDRLIDEIKSEDPNAPLTQWWHVGSNTNSGSHSDVLVFIDRRTKPPTVNMTTYHYRMKVSDYWPPGATTKEQVGHNDGSVPPVPLPTTAEGIKTELTHHVGAIVARLDLVGTEAVPLQNAFGRLTAGKLTPAELFELRGVIARIKQPKDIDLIQGYWYRVAGNTPQRIDLEVSRLEVAVQKQLAVVGRHADPVREIFGRINPKRLKPADLVELRAIADSVQEKPDLAKIEDFAAKVAARP